LLSINDISLIFYKEVDVDGSKQLDYEEFTVFLARLRTRPEVIELFEKHADAKSGYFTPEAFLKFLQTVQRVSSIK
jgi:hypothetical protein